MFAGNNPGVIPRNQSFALEKILLHDPKIGNEEVFRGDLQLSDEGAGVRGAVSIEQRVRPR